jgi:glutamate/tyrosine decarboxylase-like PLP-dependent enzyme
MLQETTSKILSLIWGKVTQVSDQSLHLRKNISPEEIINALDIKLTGTSTHDHKLSGLVYLVNEKSVNTDHGLFMNQMFGKQLPVAVLGDLLTVLLNTSMYTYEVAPVLTLIEKECVERLCSLVWNSTDRHDGVFTPGSSISNMMAMMLARNRRFPQSMETGLFDVPPFRIFVSDQVHYSFKKGTLFSGMGKNTLVEVDSDPDGKISVPALKEAIACELRKGNVPLMLIGIAGTTVTGVYDNLENLAEIAAQYNMWFHIDAAYGGSLLFSQKEKQRLKGVEHADSIAWSLHKMMGVPLSCAVLLTKKNTVLREAFSMDAEYLFHGNEMDLGQKSLQCGRRADALKLWVAWKFEGDEGLEDRVNKLVEIARRFAGKIREHKNFELLCDPETPIVCFRFTHPNLSVDQLNELNTEIRSVIFFEGHLLFNYSTHNGKIYLRCVFSDPQMKTENQSSILEKIDCVGNQVTIAMKKINNKHPVYSARY